MANKKKDKLDEAIQSVLDSEPEITQEVAPDVYTQTTYGVYSTNGSSKNYKLVKFEYNPNTEKVRVVGSCDLGNNVAGLSSQHTNAALASVFERSLKRTQE